MTLLLTKQDRTSQIKKKIRILKQRPQECKKELFFASLLPDGSVRTQGHIAEGGVVLDSLKVRIVLDVSIGYVEEKKVARIKGVTLKSLEIESFLRVDGRFWRRPFKTSAIAHGEYHRKVAEDWWRDEAPGIIADILKGLEEEIDAARHKRGDMNTREAQAIINRKMPGIILQLKSKFKEQAPIYPMDEPEARRAQLSPGPIRIWENFQIAALVNVRFGYMRHEIMEIQKIVGTKPDGIYGRKTRRAVKDLQKALGLPEDKADGLWDEEVMAQYAQQFAQEYHWLFRKEYEDEAIADAAFIAFFEGLKEGVKNLPRALLHFGIGIVRGFVGAAKGTLDIFIHPVRTVKGTIYVIFNLDEVAEVLKDKFDEYVDAAYNDPNKFMEMSGEILGEITFAVVSVKGIDKISKLHKFRALRAGVRRKIPPGVAKRVTKKALEATGRAGQFVVKSGRVIVKRNKALRRAFNAATRAKTTEPHKLGKLGQEFLEAFYKRKGKPAGLMRTELGGRVPDLVRQRRVFKDIIAEVKNRTVGAEKGVLLQLEKDTILAAKRGYKIEWHLLKGMRGRRFLKEARDLAREKGVKVIIYDYTR